MRRLSDLSSRGSRELWPLSGVAGRNQPRAVPLIRFQPAKAQDGAEPKKPVRHGLDAAMSLSIHIHPTIILITKKKQHMSSSLAAISIRPHPSCSGKIISPVHHSTWPLE